MAGRSVSASPLIKFPSTPTTIPQIAPVRRRTAANAPRGPVKLGLQHHDAGLLRVGILEVIQVDPLDLTVRATRTPTLNWTTNPIQPAPITI